VRAEALASVIIVVVSFAPPRPQRWRRLGGYCRRSPEGGEDQQLFLKDSAADFGGVSRYAEDTAAGPAEAVRGRDI